jgi:stage II sporulation SpoE-like protein
VALALLSLGSGTAAAQLPELPKLPLAAPLSQPQQTVDRVVEPVQLVVHSPLPSPLEEVVQNTPVATVRDSVREAAGTPGSGLPGGDLPGGDLLGGRPPASESPGDGKTPRGGSRDGAAPASGAQAAPDAAAPGASSPAATRGTLRLRVGGGAGDATSHRQQGTGDSPGGGPELAAGGEGAGGRADSSDRAGGADRAASPDPGAADTPEPDPATPAPSDDPDAPIVRTINRIVEVVPDAVWAALAALGLLALALLGRSHVDRRRARALLREREHLVRDMGLLERVLLPTVPERMGDLAASVAYRPAAGPAAGGDFYDVFELSGGRVGLFVGDVSGHGREALESTSALRPAMRGHLEAGLSPRAALAAAGRAAGIDPSGRFTTAVVAVHDPATGALTYATAGHPAPVLVGPAAHEPVMVGSSPPIGVGLPTGLRQTTVPLPRGSYACFFTDGLLEARIGGTLLGPEWLERVLASFGPLDTAGTLLDRVIEASDQASDDMTACLVRAVAGGAVAGPRIEELEVPRDGLGGTAPLRFLQLCGVSNNALTAALADVRRLAVETGSALLTVTIDGDDASVQVTAPTREALATT